MVYWRLRTTNIGIKLMKNYLISYDLNQTGKNYADLTAAIQTYANARRLLQSVWFIHSSKSSSAIRDHLFSYMDNNDELIVVELARGNSAWALLEPKSTFLKTAL